MWSQGEYERVLGEGTGKSPLARRLISLVLGLLKMILDQEHEDKMTMTMALRRGSGSRVGENVSYDSGSLVLCFLFCVGQN